MRRFQDGWSLLGRYTLQFVRNYRSARTRCSSARSLGPRVIPARLPGADHLHVPLWRRNRRLELAGQRGRWTISGPFNVTYRDASADRDVGPDLIGDPRVSSGTASTPRTSMPPRSARPEVPSAGRRAGRSATSSAAPSGAVVRNVDASLFKSFRLSALQPRVPAGGPDVLNHVEPRPPRRPGRRARERQPAGGSSIAWTRAGCRGTCSPASASS